jgi:hypothetical protein
MRAARTRDDGNRRRTYLRLRPGIEHVSPPGDRGYHTPAPNSNT